jgi:hypothetical protein
MTLYGPFRFRGHATSPTSPACGEVLLSGHDHRRSGEATVAQILERLPGRLQRV